MIDTLARFGTAFNDWLNKLRQSNAKALTFIVLCLGTFLVWAIATLLERKMDPVIFPIWLAFVAGVGGISLSQFGTERKTDYGYVVRAKPDAPNVAIAATEATVTGSPVSVTATPNGTPPVAPVAPTAPVQEDRG